jgi:hypothetical protein
MTSESRDHRSNGATANSADVVDLVAGRSCDGCTMCCKLLAIDVLEKPRGAWCPHCDQKQGCTIYETRPGPCRGFYCGYLRLADLDERWKPARAKFLINYEDRANRIVIHADPARPDAWRSEPFLKTIKRWAATAQKQGGLVLVWAGARATIVLPDREIDLGAVREDQLIVPVERMTAHGPIVEYRLTDGIAENGVS